MNTGHTALLPMEEVALTVALSRLLRGESPLPNTTATCVLALARITGKHDWTTQSTELLSDSKETKL